MIEKVVYFPDPDGVGDGVTLRFTPEGYQNLRDFCDKVVPQDQLCRRFASALRAVADAADAPPPNAWEILRDAADEG